MRWSEHLLTMNTLRRLASADGVEDWCAPSELERLKEFRSPQRAQQWLHGRWLAKLALATAFPEAAFSPRDVHIESRNARDRASRPLVYLRGQLQPWAVSIAHSEDVLYAAATAREGARVGVDLVPLQPLPRQMAEFWLTAEERRWCAGTGSPYAVCLMWALKEAYFKACNDGEPFCPRRVDVMARIPPARRDKLLTALSEPGNILIYDDERQACFVRRTVRAIAVLVWAVRAASRCETRRDPRGNAASDPNLFLQQKANR